MPQPDDGPEFPAADSIITAFGAAFRTAVGVPAASGRVVAALMLSEQPMTHRELRDRLGLSEGSISEGVRRLIEYGLVEQVSKPRQRPARFSARSDAWRACSHHTVNLVHTLRTVAHDSLQALDGEDTTAVRRLQEMHRMYDYLAKELPGLLDRAGTYAMSGDDAPSPAPP